MDASEATDTMHEPLLPRGNLRLLEEPGRRSGPAWWPWERARPDRTVFTPSVAWPAALAAASRSQNSAGRRRRRRAVGLAVATSCLLLLALLPAVMYLAGQSAVRHAISQARLTLQQVVITGMERQSSNGTDPSSLWLVSINTSVALSGISIPGLVAWVESEGGQPQAMGQGQRQARLHASGTTSMLHRGQDLPPPGWCVLLYAPPDESGPGRGHPGAAGTGAQGRDMHQGRKLGHKHHRGSSGSGHRHSHGHDHKRTRGHGRVRQTPDDDDPRREDDHRHRQSQEKHGSTGAAGQVQGHVDHHVAASQGQLQQVMSMRLPPLVITHDTARDGMRLLLQSTAAVDTSQGADSPFIGLSAALLRDLNVTVHTVCSMSLRACVGDRDGRHVCMPLPAAEMSQALAIDGGAGLRDLAVQAVDVVPGPDRLEPRLSVRAALYNPSVLQVPWRLMGAGPQSQSGDESQKDSGDTGGAGNDAKKYPNSGRDSTASPHPGMCLRLQTPDGAELGMGRVAPGLQSEDELGQGWNHIRVEGPLRPSSPEALGDVVRAMASGQPLCVTASPARCAGGGGGDDRATGHHHHDIQATDASDSALDPLQLAFLSAGLNMTTCLPPTEQKLVEEGLLAVALPALRRPMPTPGLQGRSDADAAGLVKRLRVLAASDGLAVGLYLHMRNPFSTPLRLSSMSLAVTGCGCPVMDGASGAGRNGRYGTPQAVYGAGPIRCCNTTAAAYSLDLGRVESTRSAAGTAVDLVVPGCPGGVGLHGSQQHLSHPYHGPGSAPGLATQPRPCPAVWVGPLQVGGLHLTMESIEQLLQQAQAGWDHVVAGGPSAGPCVGPDAPPACQDQHLLPLVLPLNRAVGTVGVHVGGLPVLQVPVDMLDVPTAVAVNVGGI